jgi:hypothetical protein
MKKKGLVSEYLPWLLIALAVLILVMISIFFIKEGLWGVIDKIKNLFRG